MILETILKNMQFLCLEDFKILKWDKNDTFAECHQY
jgi:hypothetical protein